MAINALILGIKQDGGEQDRRILYHCSVDLTIKNQRCLGRNNCLVLLLLRSTDPCFAGKFLTCLEDICFFLCNLLHAG